MLALLCALATAAAAPPPPLPLPPPPQPQPPRTVERWSVFELAQTGPDDDPLSGFNAFTDVAANATFTHEASGDVTVVAAFFDGNGSYLLRFSPERLGEYSFATASSSPLMPPVRGSFVVTGASRGNHGPVRADATNARAFAFADGSPHFSIGTTAYAWAHGSAADANKTLAALRGAAFNKLRMTLFPKYYPYTHEEPPGDFFAFARAAAQPPPNCSSCCASRNGTFDLRRFSPPFWRAIEGYVRALLDMGVQADLILFHPYDGGHWGFDCMPLETDLFYVRYAAARLGAYRNVWWSMANEWSDLKCKCGGFNSSACPSTWFDALFAGLAAADPHRRQRSIHNGPIFYNNSQPWIDHVSLQCHGNGTAGGNSTAAGSACVDLAVASWAPKPIVLDEVRYEGDIASSWGRLTAEAMTQRFWLFLAKGAYTGHSETVLPAAANATCGANPGACACNARMWWNRGAPFTGGSVLRMPFLRAYAEAHLPVPFAALASETLQPGIFWLHDAAPGSSFGLVFWDETVLDGPVQALLPLPAGSTFGARQVDFFNERFVSLGNVSGGAGPYPFTPPTAGFVLELRRLTSPPALLAAPLAMDRVALAPGSRFEAQRARNRDYLLGLNASSVLCEYTSAANLTGSLEAPTCTRLDETLYWGHFAGHYVSATAQMCNATGDAAVCERNAEVVARLAEVQQAWVATALPEYQPGYIFPNSIVPWMRLFGPPARSCVPMCVPYYVLHKMLAGMLDAHVLAGSARALDVALGMARWVKRTAEAVLAAPGGAGAWQDVLSIEFGGMNDALFSLAAATGDDQWAATAELFNHHNWTAPLAVNVDDLAGQHANTHLPQVVGDARGFELTGNETKRDIVAHFNEILLAHHSWSTGGSNEKEYWGPADRLGDQLNSQTEESCTQYNVAKVERHLFQWTLNSTFLDLLERQLFNGLVGNQAGSGWAPGSGTSFIKSLPLGGLVAKPWAAGDVKMPCCWGTLSETFARLSDSVFWESPNAGTLFVNLFVPATAAWRDGAKVRQESGFPYATRATTTLTVLAAGSAPHFTLAIRVPGWALAAACSVELNGVLVTQPAMPGSFMLLSRTWADGDVVRALFPPVLRFEPVNDARPQWQGVGAVMFGAVMLAAVNVSSDAFPLPDTSSPGLARAFARVPAAPPAGGDYSDLVFSALAGDGSGSGGGGGAAAVFIPLGDVLFERYVAYLNTSVGASPPSGAGGSAQAEALPVVVISVGAVCAAGLVAAAVALGIALSRSRRSNGAGAGAGAEAAVYVAFDSAAVN
jgi:DUF1680 family protein